MRIGLTDRMVIMAQDDDTEEKLKKLLDEAGAEAAAWIKAPGRVATKSMIRKNNLSKLSTPEQKAHDTKLFKDCVMHPAIQQMLGQYLASLKSKKKAV